VVADALALLIKPFLAAALFAEPTLRPSPDITRAILVCFTARNFSRPRAAVTYVTDARCILVPMKIPRSGSPLQAKTGNSFRANIRARACARIYDVTVNPGAMPREPLLLSHTGNWCYYINL